MVGAVASAGRTTGAELLPLVADAPIHRVPLAAAHHRVPGTVLRALGGVDLPVEVRAALCAFREQSLRHHLMVTARVGEIGRALETAGVSWVAMKGPVVAALLYPDAGDRTYGDLDLLVDRRDFAQATHILEGFGFRHVIRNWALAERMLAGQIEMKSPTVAVDLHWNLHYSAVDRKPFAFDPEAMVARRRLVAVSGVTVPTLDPVDTLLTLAFHAARSDGHRLVWLKDIERSIAIGCPDMDELVRRCRAYRCGPPVGAMLRRAQAFLDADVPDEVVTALTGRTMRTADAVVVRLVDPIQFHDKTTMTRVFTRSIRSSMGASATAGPGRTARSLRRRFFPPAENETDDPVEKERYLRAVVTSKS